MKKSRYQMIDRGLRGSPLWAVEDRGAQIYLSTRRSYAEGYLRMVRRLEREAEKELRRMEEARK